MLRTTTHSLAHQFLFALRHEIRQILGWPCCYDIWFFHKAGALCGRAGRLGDHLGQGTGRGEEEVRRGEEREERANPE